MKKIAEQGVALIDFSKLTAEENSQLEQYFLNQIAPLLSPMVVGKRQPFPFLKNKDIYAAVVLESKNSKEAGCYLLRKRGLPTPYKGQFQRVVYAF